MHSHRLLKLGVASAVSATNKELAKYFVSPILAVLLIAAVALLTVQSAAAFNPEWQWKMTGQSPTFPTKAAAVAYMHSLGSVDPRYPLLTIEKSASMVSDSTESFLYEGPMAPVIPAAWKYFDGGGTPYYFDSEEEWFADRLEKISSDSRCPSKSMAPTSGWTVQTTGWGGVSNRERRNYEGRWWSYAVYAPTNPCSEHVTTMRVYRDRSFTCPTNYGGTLEAPGCKVFLTATIEGRPNYRDCPIGAGASGDRGNPCNALTGDKHESVSDYAGPGGLTLTRHYHSRSVDETNGMGAGWSHNFQARIPPITSGVVRGLVRPNGYREALHDIDAQHVNYVSKAGSGLVVKEISAAETRVYGNDGSIEVYDDDGRLTQLKDPAGLATALAYGSDGRLASVTGPFGHQLQFQYDANGLLSGVVTPEGQQITYGYTGSNLTSVSYPDGTGRTYHYENAAFPTHLTGTSDELGNRFSSFDYDSTGRAVLTEHAGGVERYTFAYSATNSQVTDPLGTLETISFTTDAALARRITQTNKGGLVTLYAVPSQTIDRQRRVTQITDPRGLITKYVYGDYGLASKTEAFGTARARTTSYTYLNNDSDLPTLITEPGRTTSIAYNTANRVITRTVLDTATNESRTWSYTYNGSGQVLTADGPRTDVSDVTTFTYYSCATGYECGQIETITNAAGHVTTYSSYNAHGQPLTITDPNGAVTTLVYDLRQRLTSRTVGSETTTFVYWPTGLVKKVTLPDGSYLEYTYDAAHRLTDINDAEGNRIHYSLDAMGNRTDEQAYDPSNALVRIRTRVFDTLSRLQKEIGAAGTANVTTTFGYDNNDNQTSIAAPLGRDSTQGYDELNRLTSVTDSLSGVTQYGYNALDQLISVTDPRGLVTSYSYNALGDLAQQTSPDTGVTTNTYDSAGNLATTTDARNALATYTYDALNRVATAAFSDGSTTDQTLTYTYDAGTNGKGRLTGVADANHSLSWTYDDQGRTLTATQAVGSVGKTTSYTYANGLRQSMTTPSGQVITYGYTNGKVTSVSVNGSIVASNILYDPFGPVRQWTWADNSLAVRTFDQDGNIALIDSAGLKTYSYDDAFRITGITDTTNSALSWTYGYDDLDRLTSASKTGTTLGYTYDANGNRLTDTGSTPSTFTVAANSNRLSSTSGSLSRTYGYDNAGNTTSFTGISFTYNNRGRMSSSTKSGVTTNYVYNALGQLVKKASNTLYYYDDAGHILGIYDGSGALTEEIVWLGDTPIATLRPQSGGGVKVYNIHADHLNTPRVITDAVSALVRWRWDGEPFGGGAVNDDPLGAGAFEFDLRFPGQIVMAETGLYYNYHRDYDPQTGRYVQSDPIGLFGGINTYGYVRANPVHLADPLGLDPSWCTVSMDNAYRAAGLGSCREPKDPPKPELTCEQKCDALLSKCNRLVDFFPVGTGLAGGILGRLIGPAGGAMGGGIGGISGMNQGGLYRGCDAGYKNCKKQCNSCE